MARKPSPALSPELGAALERGWRLFPLRFSDPVLDDWQRLATNDPAQIRAWLDQHSNANWAAACGPESGFFAVDFKTQAALERLEADHGAIAGLRIVAPEGRVLLFRWPKDGKLPTVPDHSSSDIDILGPGRYIVIPPSLQPPGHKYEYNDSTLPVPECPPRLSALISAPRRTGADERQRIEPPAAKKPKGEPNPDPPGDDGSNPPEHSDQALALQFTNEHRANLRYTAKLGQWHIWDGTRWKKDEKLAVFDLVRTVLRRVSAGCPDPRVASHIADAQRVYAVERLARADPHHAATVEEWDSDPWLLNTPGGVVDLRTGERRTARREDYMTKITAAAPGGSCPLWLSFLDRIMGGNQALIAYLRRWCGYALTGITSEHALAFLYGIGRNGKGTFVETIAGMMGDYAKPAPMTMLIDSRNERHPTELAGLQGARLVTATETGAGHYWDEPKLKQLTGGDRIPARFMHQDFFDYLPQFKLVIQGNYKPNLRNVDEAMRARINLVPFAVTIPLEERDGKLREKLHEEWPGILQWTIDGCVAWQMEGLDAPEAVKDATDEYFAQEDVYGRWLKERCVRSPNLWTPVKVLFQDWTDWTTANNEFTGSKKRFSQSLESHGVTPKRTEDARGFLGIALRDTGPQTTSPTPGVHIVTDMTGSISVARSRVRVTDVKNVRTVTERHQGQPEHLSVTNVTDVTDFSEEPDEDEGDERL
jgi:P4 family phage/plasmid primase-like protien